MLCPICQKALTKVIDSRHYPGYIYRRRECQNCKHRFSTYEKAVKE